MVPARARRAGDDSIPGDGDLGGWGERPCERSEQLLDGDRSLAKDGDVFARGRTGKFAEYNSLRMYYVGVGGNGNTTTRFRRYIGDEVDRPLLPENDFAVAEHPELGIVANKSQTVTMIADGGLIQYWRDGRKLFEMIDPQPYTRGWFGIRTTKNHMQISHLRILRLIGN